MFGHLNGIWKPCRHASTKCVRPFVRIESCSLATCCVPSSLRPKPTVLSAELIKGGNTWFHFAGPDFCAENMKHKPNESVCIGKEANVHRIALLHQHGRRFIVSEVIMFNSCSPAGVDPGIFFRRGCTTKEWRNWLVTRRKHQARVVQRLDNAIHGINRYPVDKCWQNKPRYPLDSDLSDG